MSKRKLPLRICHPTGILKLGVSSDTSVGDLKLLIRDKLKIDPEKDCISLSSGSVSDPKWVETCKEDSDICGKVFPKRGMKVYYECLEKKKSKIVISVTYLPPVSQTIEFEFEDSSTKLSVLYCNIRAHFAGAFDDFDLKNQKTEHIYKDDDSGRTLSDVALDKGGSLIQVKCSSSSDVIVPTPTPHLDRENKSSTTTTTTKEWGLGMPCLVALTDHGPWVSGVIIKVRKSKSGKETRFTVFVPNMEPVRDVPESRLMPPENNQFVHKNTGVSSYPLVSTPYGFDALLLDTYPDGFCMIGFGRSGPTRDSLVREVYSDIFTFLKSEHASDDLETQKKRIAVARQLARRCVLASGENIRVMRHEVKRKIPLDPPMPSIPPKKELETFSLLEMDRDLENRRAYEIELHGHNFFFSEYDGGREHKVKIELHETATVGHLFTAISERLGVPEEYLVIEKFWRKDLDKAKLDSYEYLQMKAFGSIMDAGRDRYLFETLNVQTGLSRRGQDVTWFNRRDEVIVSDTRPESFRRKIGATTQFTKTPEHLLRSERFNLGR